MAHYVHPTKDDRRRDHNRLGARKPTSETTQKRPADYTTALTVVFVAALMVTLTLMKTRMAPELNTGIILNVRMTPRFSSFSSSEIIENKTTALSRVREEPVSLFICGEIKRSSKTSNMTARLESLAAKPSKRRHTFSGTSAISFTPVQAGIPETPARTSGFSRLNTS
jgi:hypothetical protein